MVLVADHGSEFAFEDELDRFDAEPGSEDPVERGRGSAALEVAQDAGADFPACSLAHLAADDLGDPAEAVFAARGVVAFLAAILGRSALGHDDHRALRPLAAAAHHLGGDLFKFERDLRDEDDIRAAGEPAVKRDPPRMAAHHFQDHHALVAVAGGMKPVQRIGHAGDRRVEAECPGRCLQVVVNGFWNADNGEPLLVQLQGGGQRAVAADDDERMEAEGVECLPGLENDVRRNGRMAAGTCFGHEMPLVHRPQDRPPEGHDAGCCGPVQEHGVSGRKEPLEPVLDADELPPELVRSAAGPVQDRVQPRAVASACQYPDASLSHDRGQSDWAFGVFLPWVAQAS